MQLTTNEGHWKKQLANMEEQFRKASVVLNEAREKLIVRTPTSSWSPTHRKGCTEGAQRFCPDRVPDHELKFSQEQIVKKIAIQKKRLAQMAEQYRPPVPLSLLCLGSG